MGWYFVAMETYVTLLVLHILVMYIVLVQSMCVPILRSLGTPLKNLENMQKSYVLVDVT